MWVVIGLVILFVVLGFQSHSESRLKKIPQEFWEHNNQQRKQDLKSYQSHLTYVKFSKFLLEKAPWIAMAIILIVLFNVLGLIIVLGALLFKKSLKDTNYRGYNKYHTGKEQIRAFDEWVVVANQVILDDNNK